MEAIERGEAQGLEKPVGRVSVEQTRRSQHSQRSSSLEKRRSVRVPFRSLTFASRWEVPGPSPEEFHKGCETAARRLFNVYDVDKTGVLSDPAMARMLSDFHGSCGVALSIEEELDIVDGMKRVGPKRDIAACSMCSEGNGMCIGCFTAMLELEWADVGDEKSVAEHLAVRGEEFEHQGLQDDAPGLLQRCAARTFRSSVLQWLIFMIIYAGLSAAVAWIVLQPFVRNEVLFSQYGVGISFARSGAALIIVGTMFLLLVVNKVFLELLFRAISRVVYLHMPMVEVHKVLAGIILGAAVMHGVAWMVTFAQVCCTGQYWWWMGGAATCLALMDLVPTLVPTRVIHALTRTSCPSSRSPVG